jgi:hypothetical protein
MESKKAESRRAQRASEPDWSLGSDSSTTALPKYSDVEFNHLEGDVVKQMEDLFGPTPEIAEHVDAEKADHEAEDSSFVSESIDRLSRARAQFADALRTSREDRDADADS